MIGAMEYQSHCRSILLNTELCRTKSQLGENVSDEIFLRLLSATRILSSGSDVILDNFAAADM